MPEGIYLDASVLDPFNMAARITDIINDKNKYYEFFKWHEYYSYHFSGENRYSAELCRFCAFLNNSMNKTSTYKNITEWWNEFSPAWPTAKYVPMRYTDPAASITLDQNKVESVLTNLINFFDPSLD